ncbi:hypothetical protein DQ04_00011080 [Trypanosoma grayi]|uniref:hypothetical protein n=1 Tax=Trypanosoma grayi TaxID=71804 RepID=UPI0004F3F2C1|nr:hypothetical protein DQ04_00011080 [Trypanosoma grayi]KEG15641.1 hypothetical protein DQ04_00011080 [Trypanosoma grayi]
MALRTDATKAADQKSPPLSLLLPCYGTAVNGNAGALVTADQWLWYFYLTAWTRPFFHCTPPLCVAPSGSGGNSREKNEAFTLSFEESLELMGLSAVVVHDVQWRQRGAETEEVETHVKAAVAEGASNCAYPPLPCVAESCFGRVLRELAVRSHLSVVGSSSCTSSLDEMVREVVAIVQQQQHRKQWCVKGKAPERLMQNALEAMLSSDVSEAHYSLLFDVEGVTSTDDDANIAETHRACLFAALAVEVFGRVKMACARMLLAYVNQSSGRTAAARACGVIMGVLEYSTAYSRFREDGTGRCPLASAALLLHSLVELQEALVREKKGAVSNFLLATAIVTCVQELIFAIVAGGATAAHAPLPIATSGSLKPKSGSGERQQQQQELEMSARPVAARAITLHEIDALIQHFVPTLLQQVGFEWPWSECLRRATQLDKVQQENAVTTDGVRISSRAVFGELLVALSRRTYMARLRCVIPQSLDTLIDAAFPTKRHNGNGNGAQSDNGGGSGGRKPFFVMPAYYQAAGEALLDFFERSGLGGATSQETERVLQRSTDVQPMIIQLQALGSRSNNNNDDDDEGNNDREYGDGDTRELLRTVRMSEEEKNRLLLRYRCEVLLASLVVYTQLQTVSVVQQLTRQLGPLFEKLLLPFLHEPMLSRPVVVTRGGHHADGDRVAGEPVIDFTAEFKVLMDDIHYEFYPLEWVPQVLNAYLRRHVTEEDVSPPLFYSVFAAVAYQFGLVLQGSPQGLRGGDGTEHDVRVKAYRFFTTLLLNSLADTVASSCDLEGAMALAATRRVGGHRPDESVAERAQLRQRGAASFHAVVNPHDAVLAVAQCLMPPELVSRPEADAVSRTSELWRRRVVEWAQSTMVRWAAQRTAVTASLVSQRNSLTFDVVPLAREVIRGVRRRLLEKMHVTAGLEEGASVDPLLQQHLLSLQSLLGDVGLLPQHLPQNDAVCSAAQLLWSSPLFSRELRLGGRYNVDT